MSNRMNAYALEARQRANKFKNKGKQKEYRPHYVGPSKPKKSWSIDWGNVFLIAIGIVCLAVLGGVGWGIYKLITWIF